MVERIATERAAGDRLQVIADRLNADGILSATGRPWNTGTVSRVANSVTAQRLAAA
ncbi:MAG: recombinase family protein [Nakamurella sp.]